jgi:PKD repeat protein
VNAGGPYTGKAGTSVSFVGAASDLQNDTFTYAWNFGDNGTASGAIATHTYTTSGTFTVTLSVISSSGTSGSATTTATITALAPVANAGGPYTVNLGSSLAFTGASSYDPQGEPLTYAWIFGDGSSGTGVSPTHTYASLGQYPVALTVTNTSGLSASSTTTATVQITPPVANAGGPYIGIVNESVSFTGAASTAPQGHALTYAWAFGDGSTGTGVTPTHTYTAIGYSYVVTLTVTDTTTNVSAKATNSVTITAPPPVANAGGPYSGLVNAAVTFSGSKSSDAYYPITYSWKFGDSATATGATPTHVYTAVGNYTVTLTVSDPYGASNTVTTTATITATGAAFSGTVYSGTTPMTGAHIYLFALNTTGYGNASVSLLTGTGYSDATGSYVLSNATGAFNIPGGYACSPTTQLYLYANNGTVGTAANSAAALMAAVGICGLSGTITMNEVSTIATAYALAGFATDSTHFASSGTSLAAIGVANAFANVTNLIVPSTGVALATTPAGNGAVPQTLIDTLANILNACVSSAGPSSTGCSTLFGNAKSGGTTGTVPTDTATAALNIAHNPAANIAALFGSTALNAPFSPALTTAPNDFTLSLVFSGIDLNTATEIVIDGLGNAWIANQVGGFVCKVSNLGVSFGNLYTYPYSQSSYPSAIAIDTANNAWIANGGVAYVSKLSNDATSGSFYPVSLDYPTGVAIDGTGNVWIAQNSNSVVKLSSSGSVLSPSGGFSNGKSGTTVELGIAVDGSGSVWVANPYGGDLSKLTNAGVPVTGSPFYTAGLSTTSSVAIDSSGNAWASGENTYSGLFKFANSGTLLSSASGIGGGGIADPYATAIDGAGNVWTVNYTYIPVRPSDLRVSEVSNAGTPLSGTGGYTTGNIGTEDNNSNAPFFSIAVDGSGDVWVTRSEYTTVVEYIGAAVPVITPIAAGLPSTPTTDGSSKLGTRP